MSPILRVVTTTLITLLLPIAHAAELAVLPVGLSLNESNTKGVITVSNHGKESVVIQAETMYWTQANGKNIHTLTQDMLVNPPLFTIPAGQSQLLRVGLRKMPTSQQEVAYRLILREVPPPPLTKAQIAEGEQGNIRVLLQLSLPVYITPKAPVSLSQWTAQQAANGNITLKLNNSGNVHILVNELKLRNVNANNAVLTSVQVNDVVLPGQNKHWDISSEIKQQIQHLMLEVKTDKGHQNVPIGLGPI